MTLGPVSRALLEDLRQEVRKHGIVVWLDRDDHYSGFVRSLEDADQDVRPFELLPYTGSHLELMLQTGSLTRAAAPPNLVLHLPKFNEDTVRETPLYELYAAGVRFRKGLDAIITSAAAGRVHPDAIATFVEGGVTSLETADRWMETALGGDAGGLSGQLGAMSTRALVDDLLNSGFVASRVAGAVGAEDRNALITHLAVKTGLSNEWRAFWEASVGALGPLDVACMVASWAMCVEYVDDSRHRTDFSGYLAPIGKLPEAVVAECRKLAEHLRERHPAFYQQTADETEEAFPDERANARAKDLGKVDTFRFEEQAVLHAALEALENESFTDALEWARLRLGKRSFWVQQRADRRSTWKLVEAAAALGAALQASGTGLRKAETVDEATEQYVQRGAGVDRAHRQLEQRRTRLWTTQIAEYETLRARLDALRERWRTWADNWSRDFSKLCMAAGFLPSSGMQQRSIFDDVVLPFTKQPGTTAYFVVDALRYEMAVELLEGIEGTPATSTQLRPRLCELPSVTSVGMNALAPVNHGGKLRPNVKAKTIDGFHTGVFRVSSIENRQRAMQERVGGTTCPWWAVEDVLARDAKSLRQGIAQASLVVVHSLGIDKSGESGFGLSAFADEIRKLRSAWELLREAGVRRFVITSDHGFLLLDPTAQVRQLHGRKVDPKRRHILRPDAADRKNEVRVALSDLNYEDAEGHVIFPDSTAVFDLGKTKMSFVHGGNSLQERVIPVLTIVHRAAAGGDLLTYAVSAKPLGDVAGMHRIEGKVVTISQQGLGFGGQQDVELALRVAGEDGIQVELCDCVRGGRLEGGSIRAKVGESFEVFFRLHGEAETRARVELQHPAGKASVEGCVLPSRFSVSAASRPPKASEASAPSSRDDLAWLQELPEGGVRQLFEHLAVHGSVNEAEALKMLGGARKLRSFSRKFEGYVAIAKFDVRIESTNGMKRYVREGSSS